ncbi:protein adenylyltransferase SelO [Rubritalea tangerina]|uniref:Protein nucleotidyltransferase YdiU n=1 Tax=Rubritalea tangerina TaxID=430798 RepID=A0ABW4Z5U3_9BACT
MPAIPFDNSYATLPESLYTKLPPESVPSPNLICVNRTLAKKLGISPEFLQSPEGLQALSGNAILQGSEPLAQAYAGHQFGHYSPQLGDGRAILLGEIISPSDDQRYDIQLKGSGRTPYSRGGDGKAALGPVMREYILSEAMHALGVPTTRALAAVTTGEIVVRQDGPQPGAIFTRIASSHIRVGTFQWSAAQGDTNLLRSLADYTIDRHYPSARNHTSPYQSLLSQVIDAQAKLVSQWMALGFIHGVMNTDNTTISGETIDYGPCAFMDKFHPNCVFSSIDEQGRYAWGKQASIILWNLTRFAETLLPLIDENTDTAIAIAEETLSSFQHTFESLYLARFRDKLGLPPTAPVAIIQDLLQLMADQEVDFTLCFTELTRSLASNDNSPLAALFLDPHSITLWTQQWKQHIEPDSALKTMRQHNPVRIPRNHRVEQAIQAAYQGDFAPFHQLNKALTSPYSESTQHADFESPPLPHEIVRETFCGT